MPATRALLINWVRAVDHDIKPGVDSDMGAGDVWPAIRRQVLASEILNIATPTWVGRPSSVAQRVLERMDAMISETDEQGVPGELSQVLPMPVATLDEFLGRHPPLTA